MYGRCRCKIFGTSGQPGIWFNRCWGAGNCTFYGNKKILPNIDTCYVASRTPESEKRFIDCMKEKHPEVRFIGCNSDCSQAACNSDIVVTAVSCQKPLLRADAVRPGTYYCHVGGWEDEYEVPLKASKIVCDDWHALKHRGSPTLARMYRKGFLKDTDIYANLAEIVDGTKPGRENEQEITYFNSIGLSFIDVGIAYDFYKKFLGMINLAAIGLCRKMIRFGQ